MGKSGLQFLLGRLAIRRGWVTARQIDECVRVQETMDVPVQLGMLMVERGLLELEQLQTLLLEQDRRLRRRSRRERSPLRDVLLGNAVVQQGLAQERQVHACLREQAMLEEKGVRLRLGEIMVRKGILTAQQLASVLARRQATIMWCSRCSGHYRVWWSDVDAATGERRLDAKPPQGVHCPTCREVLVEADEEEAEEESEHDTVNLTAAGDDGCSVAVVRATTPTDVLSELIFRTEGGKRAFGRFTVDGEVKRGGQSIFFTARRVPTDPSVGVKVLVSTVPSEVREFLAEAWLLERVRHPHILKALSHGIAEGHAYIELEIVEGFALDRWIQDHGPMTPTEIAKVFVPVLNAVEHIHRMGFVHRDLKPANLILRAPEHERPVLIDFGLACPVSRSSRVSRSRRAARTIEGSPPYMSPEQAQGLPGGLKRRTDVYGLGATLYELLTGLPPYGGDHAAQIIERVAREAPQPPSALNPDAHRGLERICLKAMARNPHERYRWPRTIKKELIQCLRGS